MHYRHFLLYTIVRFQGCLKWVHCRKSLFSLQPFTTKIIKSLTVFEVLLFLYWCLRDKSMKGSNYAFECVTLAFFQIIFLTQFHWMSRTEFKARVLYCSSICTYNYLLCTKTSMHLIMYILHMYSTTANIRKIVLLWLKVNTLMLLFIQQC